ncbi:glucose-6-phosphate dehydrogenase [Vibrio mediterranei]|uniref:Glucose-6-phosphate 1-dehydrogenase n=2 Tax=Vibrio mediterranei TaxID=689 RepID=A0A2C9PFD8_9VIBR|nr:MULTISPECIES: glucose-6-phosphate dehydrogenase [Vibrio]ASI91330.1 glucose-6-phosphate dehydrogenase [Vibrio mediterranei]AYV20222.1 glucose-6-phosphate dehydrogenase [Vibrio mediterranei]MDA0109302.1 glucose-6-phosphate dehydrogenase [Vibrio sp. La 4.2.2]NUW72877.1 glucose-6-phosphate dehydrogenase [Vibrio mediterranei]USD99406.1 glucose-6-phosphate dehydrogenase [Vibrio sp. SCSIO 43133]
MVIPENSSIVIFGASGDLTYRKLIPALYHLYASDQLPKSFAILGVSRTQYSDESYREKLKHSLQEMEKTEPEKLEAFCNHLHYQAIDTSDTQDYAKLATRLDDVADQYGFEQRNTLFYLATPPSLYSIIPASLAAHGLNDEADGWKRLIIEKPFGYDLASARQLDKEIHEHFQEHQIYRIDHYLGKETVQNLLVLRFSNAMFEPLWNHQYVDYVEITGAEFLGVEERGGYYDGSGAVRDMFQNHLLQVLAMVGMESPAQINADAIRNEVVKVLQCLRPLSDEDLRNNLVLGQYTESNVRGQFLPGYRNEHGVADDSRTETYVGLKMFIDNWRWNGVPFYVRTGKRLPTRVTEVVIHFKQTPHPVFGKDAPENKLIIRIQPDEGIQMSFGLKEPGAGFNAKEVKMNFHYASLQETQMLTAYERLLLDALNGDATLFARSDAVEACWEFVQPILDYKQDPQSLFGYACGTWGPQESDQLLHNDGRAWRFPCKNLTDTDYCEL